MRQHGGNCSQPVCSILLRWIHRRCLFACSSLTRLAVMLLLDEASEQRHSCCDAKHRNYSLAQGMAKCWRSCCLAEVNGLQGVELKMAIQAPATSAAFDLPPLQAPWLSPGEGPRQDTEALTGCHGLRSSLDQRDD